MKKVLNRKTSIKNVLLDQDVIRGIGNGYSDDILWQCSISPFSKANAIPDDKIRELAKTIKKILKGAVDKIYKHHPGLIHGEVRDYMKIHTKKKDKSPTGAKIKIVAKGMLKTYIIDHNSSFKADFVVLKDEAFRQEEFNRRVKLDYFGRKIFVVSAEDLLISKIIWIQDTQSGIQMLDIQNLSEVPHLDWGYISDWIKRLKLNTFGLIKV